MGNAEMMRRVSSASSFFIPITFEDEEEDERDFYFVCANIMNTRGPRGVWIE